MTVQMFPASVFPLGFSIFLLVSLTAISGQDCVQHLALVTSYFVTELLGKAQCKTSNDEALPV